jgi:hypothetical protein
LVQVAVMMLIGLVNSWATLAVSVPMPASRWAWTRASLSRSSSARLTKDSNCSSSGWRSNGETASATGHRQHFAIASP